MKAVSYALIAACLFSPLAFAEDAVDPATLYELSTDKSSKQVKGGEVGKWVLEIRSKPGAHVSDEAPLKIELSSKSLTLEKTKLSYKDGVSQKKEGVKYPDPVFVVPFKAAAKGQASVDAKVTFFICTDKLCVRQQKTLSLPVEVL